MELLGTPKMGLNQVTAKITLCVIHARAYIKLFPSLIGHQVDSAIYLNMAVVGTRALYQVEFERNRRQGLQGCLTPQDTSFTQTDTCMYNFLDKMLRT